MFQVHQCLDVFTLHTHNWTVCTVVVVFQLDVCLYIQRNTKISVFCYTHNEQRALNLCFIVVWQKNCITYESKTFVFFWELFSCVYFNWAQTTRTFWDDIFPSFLFSEFFGVFFSEFFGAFFSEFFGFFYPIFSGFFYPNFSDSILSEFYFIRILHINLYEIFGWIWCPLRTL